LTKLDLLMFGGAVVVAAGILVVRLLGAPSPAQPATPTSSAKTDSPKPAAPDKPAEPPPDPKTVLHSDFLRRSADAATAREHLELAVWCDKFGLADEAKRELDRTILLDGTGPDGRVAHEKLGHKLFTVPKDVPAKELSVYADRYLSPDEVTKANSIVD